MFLLFVIHHVFMFSKTLHMLHMCILMRVSLRLKQESETKQQAAAALSQNADSAGLQLLREAPLKGRIFHGNL